MENVNSDGWEIKWNDGVVGEALEEKNSPQKLPDKTVEYALLGIKETIRINCKKITKMHKRYWIATEDILGGQKWYTSIWPYLSMQFISDSACIIIL